MKNVRKTIGLALILVMLFTAIMGIMNKSYASEKLNGIVKGKDATEYQFNKHDILVWATEVGVGHLSYETTKGEFPFVTVKVSKDDFEGDDPSFVELTYDAACDNAMNASDAACISMMRGNGDDSFRIVDRLAEKFSIDKNEITLNIYIELRDINKKLVYTIKGNELQQSEEEVNNIINEIYEYDKKCTTSAEYDYLNDAYTCRLSSDTKWDEEYQACLEMNDGNEIDAKYTMNDKYDYTIIEATATLPNGTDYCLVIGNNDEWKMNWLLAKKNLFIGTEPEAEFSTTLDYEAIANKEVIKTATSEKENPFLPPYFDDDNNKKDADAKAYIRSATDEGIASTNGVAVNPDGTPNSQGWYYPDTTNTKVIAKDYPFDSYDNTTYNGMVTEKVAIVGTEGGTSEEVPNIKWTFRRKIKETTTGTDGSTTVTITYNLPVDESSIPDGWKPIYDEDGKTIHKITRTFKPSETYDKDVTVKQNGTDATNTTHVTVAPKVLSKTGESIVAILAIAVLAVFATRMYFKNKNLKKIK